jgi:glucokinase
MSDRREPLDRIPFPVIIGDIGGTNARFALIADEKAAIDRFPDAHTAAFPTIDDAIESRLDGSRLKPKSAVLAVAGPITGDRVQLTNCGWIVEPKRLIARFGLSEVILLNDFEALSLSLPGLGPDDLDPIGDGVATPEGARLVVGPGTGLGAGALIHARGIFIPVPGEGGHTDLGPVTDRDMAIWPHVERVLGRVSAEALLSGPGLVRLYRAVAAVDGGAAKFARPEEVAQAGLSGGDAHAGEAIELFATYLGRFAGDLALVFMARGGVYLAGGISAKIAPALKTGAFREAFLAKEPHRALLERMATAIVIKSDAALAGIAAFARAPAHFGVELDGRRWRG